MQRAIVTGPTGVIGTALIKTLVCHNIEVYAVCRPSSTRIHTILKSEKVHIVRCDLENLSDLPKLIEQKCDAFFHLAWEGTLNPLNRFDMYLQNQNVRYCLEAVDVANKLGCSVFVGAGSQAEYGKVSGVMHPDTPANPISGYGMAKLCAGQMTRFMCEKYQIKHIWPRILSIYGNGDGAQTLISSAINTMLRGERFSMTAGEQIWDYLYADDAGEALLAMAEKGKHGAIYVLGSGHTKKLSEYVEIIRDCISPKLEIGLGDKPYNQDQVMHMQADNMSLIEDTGWEPRIDFKTGITLMLNCIK